MLTPADLGSLSALRGPHPAEGRLGDSGILERGAPRYRCALCPPVARGCYNNQASAAGLPGGVGAGGGGGVPGCPAQGLSIESAEETTMFACGSSTLLPSTTMVAMWILRIHIHSTDLMIVIDSFFFFLNQFLVFYF